MIHNHQHIIDQIRNYGYMSAFDTVTRPKTKSEIYTPTHLVQEMLDILPSDIFLDHDKTFLDPTCGDGQFLCEILIRKIINGSSLEQALSTIYGVELQPDMAEVCKQRLLCGHDEYRHIVDKNIVCADTLTYGYQIKFDAVVGNPPYEGKAALHQQIFNKAVDLVNDDGYVVFVQPATPYQNKKDKKKKAEQAMIDNLLKYYTEVIIHHGTVFEAAMVGTDVAITNLQKTKSIPVINSITYKNGQTYDKVKIDEVSVTEMHPSIYSSILNKISAVCKQNGSVGENVVKKEKAVGSVYLSEVMGNKNYRIVPEKSERDSYKRGEVPYVLRTGHTFGVNINKESAENFYHYCESYVARIGLSMLRFNQHLDNGELNLVPMFDFSRTYTDEELYAMVGLTQEEIDAIEAFLPDYYGRQKKMPPEIYANVVEKFKAICKVNGSVGVNINHPHLVTIPKIRGHVGGDDFFTIVPKKENRTHYYDKVYSGSGVDIPLEYAENFYNYCESFVARMGLSILKFNLSLHTGELNLVPMFDFSRTYTDEELYSMVGLNQEEIDAIEAFLPDYYGRKG